MQARAAAELDVRKVVAHLALLVTGYLHVHAGNPADAKLAIMVLAPALGRAAGEHRARVLHARGDSDGHRSAAEVDRRQVVAHLTSCAATVVHVTVAELAAPAKAPALQAATARKHRARAEPARRDRADTHAAAEVDRVKVVAHLAGLVAEVLGVAGAELAERARAPALQLAVVEHHARVATAVVAGVAIKDEAVAAGLLIGR